MKKKVFFVLFFILLVNFYSVFSIGEGGVVNSSEEGAPVVNDTSAEEGVPVEDVPLDDGENVSGEEIVNDSQEDVGDNISLDDHEDTNNSLNEDTNNSLNEGINDSPENVVDYNESKDDVDEEQLLQNSESGVDGEEVGYAEQTVTVKRARVVIGRPVKWIKKIELNTTGNKKIGEVNVDVYKNATNISVKLDKEVEHSEKELTDYEKTLENADRGDILKGRITGFVFHDVNYDKNFLVRIWNWLVMNFGITGKGISEEELIKEGKIIDNNNTKEVNMTDAAQDEVVIAVEYYTEAPQAFEKETGDGKLVTISAADELGYTDILAYTELDDVEEDVINLYHIVDGERVDVDFDAYDLNGNGLIDYIEWNVPHLSNQTYEVVIEVSDAARLDSSRNFVEDVYDDVSARDGNYALISDGEYLRVKFKQELDSSRDITFYGRANESSSVEVMAKDSDVVLMNFTNVLEDKKYKMYLDNLVGVEDEFDLRVSGAVGFDLVIDPSVSGCVNITSPGEYTLNADVVDSNLSICINISSDDVVFDCGGHLVDGVDGNANGIYGDSLKNITIKNCTITDWGGEFYNGAVRINNNATDIRIEYVNASSNYHSFIIQSPDKVNFTNCFSYNDEASSSGFWVRYGPGNIIFRNCLADNSTYYAQDVDNVTYVNSTSINGGFNGVDYPANSISFINCSLNGTGDYDVNCNNLRTFSNSLKNGYEFNFLNHTTGKTLQDTRYSKVLWCDVNDSVIDNITVFNGGGVYLYDSYNNVINNSNSSLNSDYGFYLDGDNNSLIGCNAHNNSGNYAVDIEGSYNNITGCNVSNSVSGYGAGIYMGINADYNNISDCNSSFNSKGFWFNQASYNTIRDSVFFNNTEAGIVLGTSSDFNNFENCNITHNVGDGISSAQGAANFTNCNILYNKHSGIKQDTTNTTFTNCNINYNSRDGSGSVDNCNFINCFVMGNGWDGLQLDNDNILINCTTISNAGDGLQMNNRNTILNHTSISDTIRFYYGGNNSISNSFLYTSTLFVFEGDIKNNSLNSSTQGNYYAGSGETGFSQTCVDNDSDGICDSAYDVLNDVACVAGVNCSNNTDYLPLSTHALAGEFIEPGLEVVYPPSSREYSQNEGFNVTVNVSCFDKDCGDVAVYLDPIIGCDVDSLSCSDTCGGMFVDSTSTWVYTSSLLGSGYKACQDSTVHYATVEDVACDTVLADPNNGDCIVIYSPTYATYDGCPSYDRRRTAVTVGNCICNYNGCAGFNFSHPYFAGGAVGSKGGLVNTTIGAEPFYTNSSTNPVVVNLNENESEIVSFWVNATGTLGTLYDFYVYATDNNSYGISLTNSSDHWNVTILNDTSSAPLINFVNGTITNGTYEIDYVYANVTANDTNLYEIVIYVYYLNGTLYDSISTNSGDSLFANFTGVPAGEYTLTASASDTSGNSNSTSSIDVVITQSTTTNVPVGSTPSYSSEDSGWGVNISNEGAGHENDDSGSRSDVIFDFLDGNGDGSIIGECGVACLVLLLVLVLIVALVWRKKKGKKGGRKRKVVNKR